MADEDATAVKDEVVDTTAAESAPEEKLEVVTEGAPLNPNDMGEEAETEDAADTAVADETDSDSPDDKVTNPKDEWESLSGKSRDNFKKVLDERNELRRQIQELEARKAQFATEQDLINEINPETGVEYTPQEIERISWLQSREAQSERANQELYSLQVQQNQQTIDDEARQVMELPIFNPQDKDGFKPEVAEQYAQAINDVLVYQLSDGRQANRSTLLANGINPDTQATLVSYTMSPLKLAKLIANSYSGAQSQGETIGQAKAQKATEKMLANADPAANNSVGVSKADIESMTAEEYAKAKGLKPVWY